MSVVFYSWAQSLVAVAISVALGYGVGRAVRRRFGVPSGGRALKVQQAVPYAAIAFFLWATLGSPGWAIQTIDGNSSAEACDRLIYRSLHCLGTFLLAFSLAWPTGAVLAWPGMTRSKR